MKINEVEQNSDLQICVEINKKKATFEAKKDKPLKDGITVVQISLPTEKRISFRDCRIEVFYNTDSMPIKWKRCSIQCINNNYVLFAPFEGVKVNRREAFRVGLAVEASLSSSSYTKKRVIVKDVSLTGFGITDRMSEIKLAVGDQVTVRFVDRGYDFALIGDVVRVEQRDGSTIYGCTIKNMPRNLSEYISVKQRGQRNKR